MAYAHGYIFADNSRYVFDIEGDGVGIIIAHIGHTSKGRVVMRASGRFSGKEIQNKKVKKEEHPPLSALFITPVQINMKGLKFQLEKSKLMNH